MSSTTAAPTPTTGQASTPIPQAAKRRTDAGARAFVKHYMDMYNATAVRPQVGALAALSERRCKTCAAQEDVQRYLATYHQHYVSVPTRVDRLTSSPDARPSRNPYRVVMDLTTFGITIVDADNKALRSDPKRVGTFSFFLVWNGEGWKVQEIKIVA